MPNTWHTHTLARTHALMRATILGTLCIKSKVKQLSNAIRGLLLDILIFITWIKALHTEIIIEYSIKNQVETHFLQKFSYDYDAIISVFYFAKHETNETTFLTLKCTFLTLKCTFLVISCFAKYNFDAINFVFLKNTEYSVFQISQKYKIQNIPPFAGP